MRNFNYLFFLLLAAGLTITSCSDNGEKTENSDKVPVAVSAGRHTRASYTSWDEGDHIGLTMFKSDCDDIEDGCHNRKYTTTNGDGTFTAHTGHTMYYPHDGSSVDFVGYYPHCESVGYDHLCVIDISDQSHLPSIDLMTSNRFCGASKNKPTITIDFTHRLTKLLFNLELEDRTQERTVKSLVIKGMNTVGDFHLLTNSFENGTRTPADITVPVKSVAGTGIATATAIILPRGKGSGVSFVITLDDDTKYEVAMKESIELKMTTKYTFTITLRDKETPPVVSATIAPWEDGKPEQFISKPLLVEQTPDPSVNAEEGDRMTVYCGNQTVGSYTYTSDNWKEDAPIYWEEIGDGQSEKVTLRALYHRADALNDTQMPEIALCEQEVTRFEGVQFEFKLVPAKVVFVLTSIGDTKEVFTDDQLKSAKITLPSYITGYSLEYGEFNPQTTVTGTIEAKDGKALIIPQTKKGFTAIISIGNNDYAISDDSGIEFKPGITTKIIANVLKTKLKSVSTSFADWKDDDITYNKDALIVTEDSKGGNFSKDDAFQLYTTENDGTGDKTIYLEEFTYNGSAWSSASSVYWENIKERTKYNFYATCTLNPAPENTNQMDDMMYAKHEGVDRFNLIELSFTKLSAKVIVNLKSTDNAFDADELANATVTLPDYKTGASFSGGNFVTGDETKDISLIKMDYKLTWVGLIQPQNISETPKLVEVKIGANVYPVKGAINYSGAITYTLNIDMKKAHPTFNASYSDWTPADKEHDLSTELD